MEISQSNPFFTGSLPFIEELKKRNFKDADEIIQKMDPETLTAQYLIENGFSFPIVLNSTEGLNLIVPPFDNWSDLEEFVGPDTEVEVIDVENQNHIRFEFSTFLRYMKKPKRHKILNLISLECSENGLNDLIQPPFVARELDWTMKFWPPDEEDERPKVQKYCLISPKNSFTDFHIDFGGTSVWYHIVRGEKIFYIIRPSEANTSLFWNWSESRNRLFTFFGDQVDECFKCTLRAGQTLFLPTGWIHAVLTTEDSLVYGGNFLHSLSIEEQLAIYSMETKYKTPIKYKFPHFEDLHWLAGQGLLEELEDLNKKQIPPPKYLLNGLKALTHFLRQWLPNERMFFEDPIEANSLLKELSKQIRISDRLIQILNPPKPERGSTRTRKRPVYEDFIDYSIFRKKTPKKLIDASAASHTSRELDVNWHILNGGLKLMLKRGNTDISLPSTSSGIRHDDISEKKVINFSSNFASRLMENADNDEDDDDNPLQIVEFPEFEPSQSSSISNHPEVSHIQVSSSDKSLAHFQTSESTLVKEESSLPISNYRIDSRLMSAGTSNYKIESALLSTGTSNYKIESALLSTGTSNYKIETALMSAGTSNYRIESGVLSAGTSSYRIGTDLLSAGTSNYRIEPDLLSAGTSNYRIESGMLSAGASNYRIESDLLSNPKDYSTSAKASKISSSRKKKSIFNEEPQIESHVVHQDDDYIYPSLELTDEENDDCLSAQEKDDEAWSPKAKVGKVLPRTDRPSRVGKQKIAVEKGLEAAASTPSPSKLPKVQQKKKKIIKPSQLKANFPFPVRPPFSGSFKSSPKTPTKPKKGLATPKQRLGKILKLHKIHH